MLKALKWVGIAIGTVIVLVLISIGVLALRGRAWTNRTYVVDGLLTSVPNDSATIARGSHLVDTHGCRICHGTGLQGNVFLDIPPFRVVAPNLTRGNGGIGSMYSDQDFDRSIRHGVRPTGKALLVMPFQLFHNLSDADVGAIIAYVKSVPPVDHVMAPSEVRLIGYVMLATAGDDQIAPRLDAAVHEAPERGPTAEYGKYLTSHTCVECHGKDLHGGKSPDPNAPPAPPLLAAGYWSLPVFSNFLHTGVRPDGRPVSDFMPWKGVFDHLDDVEIAAVHAYLKSLSPPQP